MVGECQLTLSFSTLTSSVLISTVDINVSVMRRKFTKLGKPFRKIDVIKMTIFEEKTRNYCILFASFEF